MTNNTYNGNVNLKALGVPMNFSVQQAMEYVKCQDDYLYFIKNYCKVVSLDRGLIPFQLYEYQEEFLNTIHENRNTISMMSRQMGKCVTNDINICVRNKKTGEIYELPIGDFYRMQKDHRDKRQEQNS